MRDVEQPFFSEIDSAVAGAATGAAQRCEPRDSLFLAAQVARPGEVAAPAGQDGVAGCERGVQEADPPARDRDQAPSLAARDERRSGAEPLHGELRVAHVDRAEQSVDGLHVLEARRSRRCRRAARMGATAAAAHAGRHG